MVETQSTFATLANNETNEDKMHFRTQALEQKSQKKRNIRVDEKQTRWKQRLPKNGLKVVFMQRRKMGKISSPTKVTEMERK